MAQAGEQSPHLNERERRQAASRTPLGPLVIHEIVREQGEAELERGIGALAWSGLAAGLSIGFSFLVQSYLQAGLPDLPWRPLVSSFGYSVGFLIVVLGQQQLFTETTLTALIPTLTRLDWRSFTGTLRVWGVVLLTNLAGTLVFAAVAAQPGIFRPDAVAAMAELSAHAMGQPFLQTLITAGSAGWLIGLMVWLLPGAGPARPLIVILITYVVALCGFPHIVAGSAEAAFGVFAGHAQVGDYLLRFLVPTLVGNVIGGTVLVALLNHAPLANELHAPAESSGD